MEILIIVIIVTVLIILERFFSRLEKVKKEKEAKEQRRKAIIRARQRPDLFKFDPSVGIEEIKKHEKARNPVAWAEAIQKRYGNAEAALHDATIVVNDDIDKLAAYRKQLHQDIVQKYERVIRPFKDELSLSADKIPHPKGLVSANNFSFPQDMQPQAIQKKLNSKIRNISSDISISINNYISGRGGFSNLNKGDAVVIGIQFVIAFIRQEKIRSEQLQEVQKLQADVDTICEQISGAIKVLGEASDEIKYLHKQHEDTASFMMQYYETVKTLTNQNKSLQDLSQYDLRSVEALYVAGKQLKRLMQINVMKSNNG
jgi:hypothetical protein